MSNTVKEILERVYGKRYTEAKRNRESRKGLWVLAERIVYKKSKKRLLTEQLYNDYCIHAELFAIKNTLIKIEDLLGQIVEKKQL